MPRFSLFLLALVGSVALACGDPFAGTATQQNFVDTVTLYALRNTSVRLPSAYSLLDLLPVRTDTTSEFDFAVNIDAAGSAVIYPAGALHLSPEPGIQVMDRTFDNVKSAPLDGYVSEDSVTVEANQVFVVRSRATVRFCVFFASLPRYGKFRVLEINEADRSIVLESLVDLNSGFRGLEPGIPSS
jgi:hypothetical protein